MADDPAWLRREGEELILTTRVQPRASRDKILGAREGVLAVSLTAPPVEGAANEAVIRLFAKALHVAKGGVRIVRGERSRDKVIRITGAHREQVTTWLRGFEAGRDTSPPET
ncbi:MAG: YggU family protein [Magnetococcales bacterium]|nr:YggU family protein [Magnetococcales bacterium]